MAGIPRPDGRCWCGCGEGPGPGRYFKPGHDAFAQNKVREMLWGDVVNFLTDLGFGPDARNVREEWQQHVSARVRTPK